MGRKKAAKRRPNGAGSVYWSTALDRYVGAAGTPRRYVYGPRGDDSPTAQLAVTEKLNGIRKRPTHSGANQPLGDYLEEWLKASAHLRRSSQATYAWAVEKYILPSPLSRKRLGDITPTDVRQFFSGLTPLPPQIRKDGALKRIRATTVGIDTKRKIRAVLHRAFEAATEEGLIDRNPADKIRLPEKRRQLNVWEPDEVLLFLREARKHPLYPMFLLAITSTMGPAELFGLQKRDVHLKGGYLWVVNDLEDVGGKLSLGDVKTPFRRRRIDLPEMVIDALREHMKSHMSSPFVFTTTTGAQLRRSLFRRRVWIPLLDRVAQAAEKAAEEAGVVGYTFPRIRFYDLRHSCNALMGFLGVPLDLARSRMGHSSISTTVDVYGHIYQQQGEMVARKFDEFLSPLKNSPKESKP